MSFDDTVGALRSRNGKESTLTIRDLYPNFSEKQLEEAQDNLDRYLALVLHIFERAELQTNPQADPLTPNTGTLPCTAPGSEASALPL